MRKIIDPLKRFISRHLAPQSVSDNGTIRMVESSIIKLDRPYPIVQFKSELFMQVGSLFVITGEEDGIDPETGDYCKIPAQKVYPILSNEDGQFGFEVYTNH